MWLTSLSGGLCGGHLHAASAPHPVSSKASRAELRFPWGRAKSTACRNPEFPACLTPQSCEPIPWDKSCIHPTGSVPLGKPWLQLSLKMGSFESSFQEEKEGQTASHTPRRKGLSVPSPGFPCMDLALLQAMGPRLPSQGTLRACWEGELQLSTAPRPE